MNGLAGDGQSGKDIDNIILQFFLFPKSNAKLSLYRQLSL